MSHTNSVPKVSIIGLGKLGLSMLVAFARAGVEVVGVDINIGIVNAINAAHFSDITQIVKEPGLCKWLGRLRGWDCAFSATNSVRLAVHATDITFVVVPTPSEDDNLFSIKCAAKAFGDIGTALKTKDGYHLVVLTSTVTPGATQYGLLPILEKASGKVEGKDFGLCYSPEFIALGEVVEGLRNPDFVLIGEIADGGKSGNTLVDLYNSAPILTKRPSPLHGEDVLPPMLRCSIEEAEVAKLALNAFLTMKISYANSLSLLCSKIPNCHVDMVTSILGCDSRISPAYLKGGAPYGGPCFPRDTKALRAVCEVLRSPGQLVASSGSVNKGLSLRIAALVRQQLAVGGGNRVGIMGMAYKMGTPVLEPSLGTELVEILTSAPCKIAVYDSEISIEDLESLGSDIKICTVPEECVDASDVIVLALPDPVFIPALGYDFLGGVGTFTFIDVWRFFGTNVAITDGVTYIPIGRHSSEMAADVIKGMFEETFWKERR